MEYEVDQREESKQVRCPFAGLVQGEVYGYVQEEGEDALVEDLNSHNTGVES